MGDIGGGIVGGLCGALCAAVAQSLQWTFCATSHIGSDFSCCDKCCRCRCCYTEGALPVEDYPNPNSLEHDPNGQARQLEDVTKDREAGHIDAAQQQQQQQPPPEYRPTEQMQIVSQAPAAAAPTTTTTMSNPASTAAAAAPSAPAT
ncbi:uncharacterized protein PFL1_06704 [Pseudozyma flocculosa PF-1]|uniref:Uncharacterized protein n=2 Tax=Pseudozyma flocculosa TaxID=84751 RepID=A0A5C3F4P9_9BASI|nr:uncharacterized protein PFL1_06704 [Pseudozyma flocculosa PF-1]EPQ25710.1 hypothetical protein PFL1_06704 [Pseudozyma flocculosa PF-1]SPO38915.1 uncharacterized protein PSFLO_04394 [Pseudozyma flocculosa]